MPQLWCALGWRINPLSKLGFRGNEVIVGPKGGESVISHPLGLEEDRFHVFICGVFLLQALHTVPVTLKGTTTITWHHIFFFPQWGLLKVAPPDVTTAVSPAHEPEVFAKLS